MTSERFDIRNDKGFTVVYVAVFLTVLGLFTGLAIDTGRAYEVKAQLSKAVDGAALGAARMLNSGDPRGEAQRIFKQNFPAGYLGTAVAPDPTTAADFFSLTTDMAGGGVNIVTVKASTVMPTTFMKLADFDTVTVSSMGEATRRMVDLSLVLDVSSSIGSKWGAVRDAARTFIDAFDAHGDRLSLVTFGNGAIVRDQMPSGRGFDKARMIADVPNGLPGGSTQMVEGLYRGWDELRTVAAGTQSGLRVIVLFTDGASNSVPGIYEASPGVAKGLRTYDFPKNLPDPDGQTWDNPQIVGLFDTESGAQGPSYSVATPWNSATVLANVPWLPLATSHAHHRSSGIPTTFPLQTNALTVDGVSQSAKRGLRQINPATGRYPAQVFNVNNAARNVLEIIANGARSDDGDYKIRIYTIGMGELVQYNLGTIPEKPENILKRIANDKTSLDYNSAQLEGKYFFAKTGADVGPAFQALQNQIIRLSR